MISYCVTKTLCERPETELRRPASSPADQSAWSLVYATPVVITETSGDYPVGFVEVIAVWMRVTSAGSEQAPGLDVSFPRHPPDTLPGLSEIAVRRGWNRRADADQWWCGNILRVERSATAWTGWDNRDVGQDFADERKALAYALGFELPTEATP